MRKLLLFFLTALLLLCSVGLGVIAKRSASAEEVVSSVEMETKAEIVPKTADSEWFEEILEPILIRYGVDVLAFLTAAGICLKGLKKAKKIFETATAIVTASHKDNESLSAKQTDLEARQDEYEKAMDEKMDKRFQEMEEKLVSEVDDTNKTVHKLLDVEEIAYTSNPVLVSNGAAKRIAEVVKHENANKA
ncbi:MAG: hypothetical protein IJX30_00545 [Clostridia bacterium]|nr:hypothetical protein [Clostridia bacterium]MBQ8428575.1 hypothetical protein [Clostridia bacterium]